MKVQDHPVAVVLVLLAVIGFLLMALQTWTLTDEVHRLAGESVQRARDAASALVGTPPEARAGKFILEDNSGKTRAVLAMLKDGPGLTLYDENGKPRAVLTAFKNKTRLSLVDENGKDRFRLGVIRDSSVLGLADEKGNLRATLGVTKDGPGLALYDEDGKGIWQAP